MTYLRLVAAHRQILAFGFALTFFSSFGQTFFIALFGAEIREEFNLTHGSFGALYSAATLVSGLCLIWLGTGIDRFPLRRYARVVIWGLVLGAALFGLVKGTLLLWLAIFLMRLFGQGLMGHTAMTTMARFFQDTRGKAMSIAALGFPVGEAIFPRAFVGVKDALGWRPAWWIIAVGLALTLIPFVERLLRHPRPDLEDRKPEDGEGSTEERAGGESVEASPRPRDKSRRDVLRDPRFYLVLPAVLAPPFIATGLFFHQIHLVESKGWSLGFFAGLFAVYGAAQLVSSLAVGPLVDRYRASRLLPFYLIPLAVALAVLGAGRSPMVAVLFMIAFGLSGGAQSTIVGAYWAETYGVRHLGAIRSLAMALMVFSTAAAPVLLGRMIDGGSSMELIAILCLGYAISACVLAGIGVHGKEVRG